MTWRKRIEHIRDNCLYSPETWKASVEAIQSEGKPLNAVHRFELVNSLSVLGVRPTRDCFVQLQSAFSRTLAKESPATKSRTDPVFIATANLVLAFQSIGLANDEQLATTRALVAALRTRRHESPVAHWEKALFGIAMDDEAIWRNIAGVDPRERLQFDSGETFSLNVQGLIRYLAAARRAKARFEDVLPAWDSFLSASIPLIEADQIGDETVLWVSRIVHHDIGGHPLNEFGGWFHAEIQRAVAAGI